MTEPLRPVRILVDDTDWEDPTDPYSEAFDQGGDLPLSCECYDPVSMEYSDEYPCSYCRRLEAQELA